MEEGVIFVQRVQARAILQRQIGKLAQQGGRKLVEQAGFRTVRDVLPGEKARLLAIGGEIGPIQEVGDAAVHVLAV